VLWKKNFFNEHDHHNGADAMAVGQSPRERKNFLK
jgi:hypothetical protein